MISESECSCFASLDLGYLDFIVLSTMWIFFYLFRIGGAHQRKSGGEGRYPPTATAPDLQRKTDVGSSSLSAAHAVCLTWPYFKCVIKRGALMGQYNFISSSSDFVMLLHAWAQLCMRCSSWLWTWYMVHNMFGFCKNFNVGLVSESDSWSLCKWTLQNLAQW